MKLLATVIALLLSLNIVYSQCALPGGFDPTGFEYIVSASYSLGGDGPMPGTLTSKQLSVETDFDIDQDATWDDCTVQVLDGGSINVESGNTLEITGGSLVTTGQSGDGWTGIIVENGGTLIVDDASIVCRAETAVHIKITSSGDVTIADASLIDNYRGIEVDAYTAGLHPAEIYGTTIKGENSLPSGFPQTYSSIGIRVDGVSDGGSPTTLGLIIGDPSELANTFENLDLGVDFANSTVLVQNSDFVDIDEVNAALNLGIAIRGAINGSTNDDLFVGTSASRACTFVDCRNGVQADNFDEVKVSHSSFSLDDGNFIRGVLIENTENEVVVSNNTINDFKLYGIRTIDNATADLNIHTNTLSSAVASAGCDVTAIEVHESGGTGAVIFAVQDNIIDEVQIGIELANTETIVAEDNVITISQQSCTTTVVYGIVAQGCDDAVLEANIIDSDCGSSPCTDADFVGIGSQNSPGILFDGNEVDLVGYGIYVVNDNMDGNAVCNVFTDCGYGFGFNSVAGGSEFGPVEYVGDPGEPSDNKWFTASTAGRTHCFSGSDCNDFEWYYRDGASTPAGGTQHDASLNNLPTGGATTLNPTTVTSTNDDCGETMRLPDWGSDNHSHTGISTFMAELLDSVSNAASPSEMGNSVYSYLELAHLREQNEQIIADLLDYTNIRELDSVENLINVSNLEDAQEVFSRIEPINDREALKLLALKAILQARDTKTNWTLESSEPLPVGLSSFLTESNYNILDSISMLEPGKRGDAVIMARSILNRLDLKGPPPLSKLDQLGESTSMRLYPNPVSKLVNIVSDGELMKTVKLVDVSGHVLQELNFDVSRRIATLDVSQLQNGTYVVSVVLETGVNAAHLVVVFSGED